MEEDNPGPDQTLYDSDQNASLESTPTPSSYLKRIFVPRPNFTTKLTRRLLKTMHENSQHADANQEKIDPSKGHESPARKNIIPSRFRSIIRNAILGRKDSPNTCYPDQGRSEGHGNDRYLGELTSKEESDCAEVAVGSPSTSSEDLNREQQTLAEVIASSLSVTLSLRESVGEEDGGKGDKANGYHGNGLGALPSLECKATSGIDGTSLSCTRTSSWNAKTFGMSRRTRRTSYVQTPGSKDANADEEYNKGQEQCEQKIEGGSNKKRNKRKEANGKNRRPGAGEELCKKRILIGKRCKPLTLSHTLHYDKEGVIIPEMIP